MFHLSTKHLLERHSLHHVSALLSNSRLMIRHQKMTLLSVTRNTCVLTGCKIYSHSH